MSSEHLLRCMQGRSGTGSGVRCLASQGRGVFQESVWQDSSGPLEKKVETGGLWVTELSGLL